MVGDTAFFLATVVVGDTAFFLATVVTDVAAVLAVVAATFALGAAVTGGVTVVAGALRAALVTPPLTSVDDSASTTSSDAPGSSTAAEPRPLWPHTTRTLKRSTDFTVASRWSTPTASCDVWAPMSTASRSTRWKLPAAPAVSTLSAHSSHQTWSMTSMFSIVRSAVTIRSPGRMRTRSTTSERSGEAGSTSAVSASARSDGTSAPMTTAETRTRRSHRDDGMRRPVAPPGDRNRPMRAGTCRPDLVVDRQRVGIVQRVGVDDGRLLGAGRRSAPHPQAEPRRGPNRRLDLDGAGRLTQ